MNADDFKRDGKRILTALALLVATIQPGLAQDKYPARAVRIIVPSAAGGSSDTGARLIAQEAQKRWGQSVVVENRAGAATIIGTEVVACARRR